MIVRRAPRKRGPKLGYVPSEEGEKKGYKPARRTRKAPRAYWCRRPYPDGFGLKGNGSPQPLAKVEEDVVPWWLFGEEVK